MALKINGYVRAICVMRIYLLFFAVHDLNTETLELDEDASPAGANLQALFHYWRAAEVLTCARLARLLASSLPG